MPERSDEDFESICQQLGINCDRLANQPPGFYRNLVGRFGYGRATKIIYKKMAQRAQAMAGIIVMETGKLEGVRMARRAAIRAGEYRPILAEMAARVVTWNYLKSVQDLGGRDFDGRILQEFEPVFEFAATFLVASHRHHQPRESLGCIKNSVTCALRNCADGDGLEYAEEQASSALKKLLDRHKDDPQWPKRIEGLITPELFAACEARAGRHFHRDALLRRA